MMKCLKIYTLSLLELLESFEGAVLLCASSLDEDFFNFLVFGATFLLPLLLAVGLLALTSLEFTFGFIFKALKHEIFQLI
jgi:hypothetical protein